MIMLKSRSAMLAMALIATAGSAIDIGMPAIQPSKTKRRIMRPAPYDSGMTQEQRDWNEKVVRRNKRVKR
jgi:hypothetical protein